MKLTPLQAHVIRIVTAWCSRDFARFNETRDIQTHRTTQHSTTPFMLTHRLSSCPQWFSALAFGGIVLASITPASAENQPDQADQRIVQSDTAATATLDDVNPSIVLKGSVWRTKPGIVFLRTPIGLLTLSSKTTLKDFRASQEAIFWVHGPHLVVDIRKRADGSLVHRYLSGPFMPSEGGAKDLPRWTPEGDTSFHYGTYERSLAALREGDPVTVEVDDSGTVIGVHDLQFDLQVGQVPASGSEAHLLLTGTVSKLKSNFIFFRTPIGVVNVNAKIGIKNAKVGQTMTLHIHQHHVVADLSTQQATAPAHRFVTGPLQFATPEHTSVKLWTPDGEQTYPIDRVKSALAGAKEGNPITVELNGQGTVVDFHRFN